MTCYTNALTGTTRVDLLKRHTYQHYRIGDTADEKDVIDEIHINGTPYLIHLL